MEDTGVSFIAPEHVHPRRGGATTRPFVADPGAGVRTAEIVPDRRGGVGGALAAPSTPETVRAAVTQWLAGNPAPVGAAAVAAIKAGGRTSDDVRLFADLWIGEHGLRFAATAAVEMASMLLIDDHAASGTQHYPSSDRGVRHLRPGETQLTRWPATAVLLRVRAALAVAPDDEFEQVVTALMPFREGLPTARAACSTLVPRPDWVDADVADTVASRDSWRARLLLHATADAGQARLLAEIPEPWHLDIDRGLVFTLLDGVGPSAVSTLFHWLDQKIAQFSGAGTERWLFSLVATIPGDDVMTGLLSRSGSRAAKAALLEAARRFPARAMRILAEHDVADLLRGHVVEHLDLVNEVTPLLSLPAAGRVQAIVRAWHEVVTAPLSAVPPVLADPPWSRRQRVARPPVVTGLACTDVPAVTWLPGEREEWAERRRFREDPAVDWPAMAEKVINGTGRWDDEPGLLFARAPEEIARATLVRWEPRSSWDAPYWMPVAAARLGTDMLPALLTLARATPADYAALLLPFTSTEVAVLVADWSARLKTVRGPARQWLLRHPGAAARALIPPALGKPGTARRQAERVLLLLHGHGHTEEIRQAAAGYGPEAAAGVEALFVADPLAALPARMPTPPVWAAPGCSRRCG
ncbi:hypothetical protein [Actinoplanes sp. CA-252034]|uniref:hypothetical protein n=1 Tax=Actinoplanes sp. CA-252034 TaxID=3239906 RepID=UPI003D97079B